MSDKGSAETGCCTVLELRQYTLKPGQREALIELFERHFIESQEAAGMTVVGQFRDRHRPDRFVWLRGFPNMERRHLALEAFYGGPVWSAHRSAANDTMVDSDDVLLLRPARPDFAFQMCSDAPARNGRSATVLAGIYQMPRPVDDGLVSEFERQVIPILQSNRVHVAGVFVTESAANTFTRLPVREGEHVLAWFGVVPDLERSPAWIHCLASMTNLGDRLVSLLELEPTPRSILGGGANAARANKVFTRP
jgi:NIPSNAP